MSRTVASPLIAMMILGVLAISWHSSANVTTRSQVYKSEATPTATPTPSPSPSPGVTPTPVPEPEPVPSPTPTPFINRNL